MHLAVEAVGIKHSGGAVVLQDFLKAAVRDDRLGRISVFCSPKATRNFALPDSEKIEEVELHRAENSHLYRLLWLEHGLALRVQRCGADALLCMTGAGRAPSTLPQATVVQQSLPFHLEAYRQFGIGARLRIKTIATMMGRACRQSRTVLVQTPTMRRQVSEAFDIPAERIRVFLPAPAPLPPARSDSEQLSIMRRTRPDRRLLYVGNQSPYKNVTMMAEAMSRIRRAFPDAGLFLTWPEDNPLTGLEGVHACGYLDAETLAEAYELATVLVMPSLAETVGLPMLEAMSAGTPVLAADRPYAHDICEDAALFFNPLNAEDFAEKAITLMSRPEQLRELSMRGRKLVERRRAGNPYQSMVDAIVETLSSESRPVECDASALMA